MRLRNTLILLLIAAAFLVYFLAVEQPRHREELQEFERSKKITDLQRETIYHVTIWRDDDTLAFTREGDNWRMIQPVVDKANTPAVNTLVATALGADIERSLPPGDNNGEAYGLGTAPDAILLLQTVTKDTSLTIRLGGHNITKSHFYAQVGTSHEVLLLPAGLRRYALQKVTAFRDDQLIDFPREEAWRFRISSVERTLLWVKDSHDRWTAVLDGDTIMGDQARIDAILRRLRGLRVREFLSDRPKEYPHYFPKEASVLSFWIGSEGTERSVHFSKRSADTCHAWVAGSDRIVSINATILDAFTETYDDLRDRNVFHFDREAVARIRMTTPDTTATIIKTGSEWAFANPALGSIDPEQFGELLRRMEGLQFGDVIENRIGASSLRKFERPSLKLTVYDGQENVIDELSCSPQPDDESSFLATSRSSRLLGGIETDSLSKLEQSFRNLRSQ
jgi:hypothetical protein